MRTLRITLNRNDGNQTLAAVVKQHLGVSWSQARSAIQARRVRVNGAISTEETLRLRTGAVIEITDESPSSPSKKTTKQRPVTSISPRPQPNWNGPEPKLIYLDESILIVDKPAGLTTMRHPDEAAEFGQRGKRFLPKTLQDLLPTLLSVAPFTIRAVHRIDRDTSGLVVFARTEAAQKSLDEQFRKHTIRREYLALVRGTASSQRIESVLIVDRGDGRRGSNRDSTEGQKAVTHVHLLESFEGFSLVQCRLETGRTHQVRIHLGEQGNPLCGERVYDRPLNGSPLPDGSPAERPMLHAAILGLHHPDRGEWLEWESPIPQDMADWLEQLRSS
jgi:23S rRNA pseudouridine1911/1915/1917 synthase